MNNDEKGKELLAIEEVALQDISGVLQAMDTMEEYETFTVTRGGKNLFSFRLRGLNDEEVEKCRTESTKMKKNKKLGGITVPAEFDSAKNDSLLIVTATHPEDRKFLWDNKELQKRAEAVAPWQVVDKTLKSGEKEQVIELIEKLSGYEGDDLIEVSKNL